MHDRLTDYHARRCITALAAVVLLAAASVYALYTPPHPEPQDAPATAFSAERAMKHIEEIAQRPHPVGSLENTRVRDYLVAQIEALGLEPITDDTLLFEGGGGISNSQSVLARIKGTDSTGAIMLTGHYDSVPYGPGAADDCSGVATVLETARALLAGPALKNDIILHLSDGEENGLLGAKSFMKHGPWREDLALVVNFEARGHRGPSLMFQTSDPNGRLVREYMAAAPYPVASSVMFDIARLMPTTTDYWVYKAAGVPGFDFAFVGGLKYYHTVNDSPEHLSPASVQGHGENCLALARQMGAGDLTDLEDENLVYFNTFGHHMLSYPATWVWPLTYGALIFFILTLILGLVRRVLSPGSVLKSVGWYLLALVTVPVIILIPLILGLRAFGPYALYNQIYFVTGFVLLTIAVFLAIYGFASRRIRMENLWTGALLVLGILLFLQSRVLPLGGYLFLWPFFFGTLGLLASVLTVGKRPRPWLRLAIVLLSTAPAVILIAPQLPMMFDTFSLVLGPIVMLLGAQLLGHLVPVLCHVTAPARRMVPLIALALAIPPLVWGVYHTTYSQDRPKMNYLAYGMNLDTQDACWVTKADQEALDVWLENFFSDDTPSGTFEEFDLGNSHPYLRAPAALADIEEAVIEETANEVKGDRRHLRFLVRPARETAGFTLFTPGRVRVHEAKVNGQPHGNENHRPIASWIIHYKGRCDGGIVVDLEVDADERSPALTLIEHSYGLPTISADPVPPRPDWMIPQTNTMPDVDFSWEAIKTGRLIGRMIQFSHLNLSTRNYVRQTFRFPQQVAPAATTDQS